METNNNEIILRSLFYNKVNTANEKIKIIKDNFDLTLKNLAGENLSKNCISNIINGKQGITERSGPVLVKNINSLLMTNLTLEWLLEEPSKQVTRLLETNIESYKKGQISINDLEKIINDNTSYADTDLLLKSYEVLIKGYMDVKHLNYNKALIFCEKGIEIAFKISNYRKEVLFKNFRACIELEQGNAADAFRIYESIKERTSDKELQFKIQYNIIICLRKLKKFEKMFEEMNSCINKFQVSEEDKRYLKIMKANSLACLKKYEKALELHEELLIEYMNINDIESMCMQYFNIADIHFEKGDLELAKKYISLRLEQENDIYIVKHLLFAATIFNDLTYVEKAKKHTVEGDLNSLYAIYNKEIELCIKNNNVERLKSVLDICIEQNIKIEHLANLNRFMYYNLEKEEYEKYLELFKDKDCF